jgi:serine/threonine-protein kinase
VKSQFETGAIVPGTHYRVVAMLGAGGMGSVYEVEHIGLGKRFVLKALLASLSGRDDLALRLRNEQRALGRLEHPNIVGVTDAGVATTGVPYFVMERLEGETLGDSIRRRKQLPIVEALEIAAYILDGLAAAHEIGVVHRDVKPQNVFLVRGTFPKILDFGVAKMKDAENVITRRGIAVGTPRYMSPEQASGDAVDGRSDIYAVGLVLFECIAGFGPFDGARDANELLLAHLGERPPLLSSVRPGITEELDQLMERLLAKNPAYRPPSAQAAAAALRDIARRLRADASGTLPRMHLEDPAGQSDENPTVAQFRVTGQTESDVAPTLVHRGSSDTDVDWPSRQLTVAGTGSIEASARVRTERLEPVAPYGPSGNEVTRTRVPMTPAEGSVSVPPAGAVRPLRGPRLLLSAAAVSLAVLAGLMVVIGSRARATRVAPEAQTLVRGSGGLSDARAARPDARSGAAEPLRSVRAATRASAPAPEASVAERSTASKVSAPAVAASADPRLVASGKSRARPAASLMVPLSSAGARP